MLADKWVKFLLENLEEVRSFQQMYQHGNDKIPKLYSNEMLRGISDALLDDSISEYTSELEESYWWCYKDHFDSAADVGMYWAYESNDGGMTIDMEPDENSAPYIGLYLNEGQGNSRDKIVKQLTPLHGKYGIHVVKKLDDKKMLAWVSLRDSVHFEWLLEPERIRTAVRKQIVALMKAVFSVLK